MLLVCPKYKGDAVNCPHWSSYFCGCSLANCVYERIDLRERLLEEISKLKNAELKEVEYEEKYSHNYSDIEKCKARIEICDRILKILENENI